MVCNLVTYRARSAVREVGYALGFPRPLVDRVAKALETYDWVMVRRDLEADGGFAEFFRRPGEGLPAEAARGRGRRGARPRRRDGPAEHADAARREGAALAPATEAGGPGRAATVRLAPARATARAPARRTPRSRRSRDDALAPPTAIRPAGRPTTRVAGRHAGQRRLAAGRARDGLRGGTRTGWSRRRSIDGRRVDPESGQLEPPPRATDRAAAGPRPTSSGARRWDPPAPRRAGQGAAAAHSSVARVEPEPPPQARGGSTVGLSRLGALARVLRPDRRLPAPPLDPFGRDARDRGAAHRHRADRAGDDGRPGRRPVRQARRRDAQAHQARPARARDAGRDGRDAPADRARLRGLPRPRPPARGRPRGLRDAPGGRHGRRLPGREPGPDADAPEVAPEEPRRPRGRGRDHPAGPDPGQRRPPVPAPQAGPRAGDLPPPEPRADPQGLDGRDPLPGAGHAHRHRGRRASPPAESDGFRRAMGTWRSSREMEKLHRSSSTAACASPG